MNIIIIEDEQFAFKKLAIMLNNIDNNINIVGHAKSVSEAVELIRSNNNIDLGFFDIQLADGLSFSIFDRIKIKFPIIFTTAYDNHAIRAFKHNSIDYLLKPIRMAELKAAYNKFEQLWKPSKDQTNILNNIYNQNKRSYKERFTVKVGEHIKMIKIEEINCFYSYEKGSFLQTIDERNYLIDYSLEELFQKLNPKNFFRVNRKYIINIDAIYDIIAYSNSRLKIILKTKTDSDIIVSREKVKTFKKWLG
ncbi:MAG: DNA-binding response regulator [Bacteroidetes bacterium]|nr:MAG: DNA-binding response regulator [Bacteroidota bacterium]